MPRKPSAARRKVVTAAFPFDCFGGGGTADGAKLLADLVREILDDAALETRPHRQAKLPGRIRVLEEQFTTVAEIAAWRATGRDLIADLLGSGEFVLWLAGNHLGVLPVYEALGPTDLVILFDAHLDCYQLHDVEDELSHGNFLRLVARGPKVAVVGHRDLFLPAAEVKKFFVHAASAADWTADPTGTAAALTALAAKADRVWIDLDVDAFDPAACPAVREPLPFGPSGLQLLNLISAVWSEKVVGVSLSEFDPGRDVRDAGLHLLGWLVEWLLLKVTSDE